MSTIRKIIIPFGLYGLKALFKDVETLTPDYVKQWLCSKLKDVIDVEDEDVDHQTEIIAKKIVKKLKNGTICKKIIIYAYPKHVPTINEAKDRRKLSPPPVIRKLAKKAGVSLAVAKRYWEETEAGYKKWTGKTKSELTPRDYQYIVGVVKKRMGLPVKKVRDLHEL